MLTSVHPFSKKIIAKYHFFLPVSAILSLLLWLHPVPRINHNLNFLLRRNYSPDTCLKKKKKKKKGKTAYSDYYGRREIIQ